MMYLTFDWDSVGLEDIIVQEGLLKLSQDFPNNTIYHRISASGTGIHAIISPKDSTPTPIELDDEDALNYRMEMVIFGLEDEWRLKGDEVRMKRGLPTSQLWEWKDGKKVGEWIKYVE
jgi:hypothetical protein|tara:strand:- start:328 stop:681 length:354 start_codon:yes stop_codon:yes gene_type:complete